MRRRRHPGGEATADLFVFDGRRYRTEATWTAAFAEFRAAREAWSQEHDGATLAAYQINGHCPFDPERFRKSQPKEA